MGKVVFILAKVRLNISLDETLLQRIDQFAEENFLSRSGLLSVAANEFINSSLLVTAFNDVAFSIRKIADNNQIDDESLKKLEDFEKVAKMLVSSSRF